MILVVNLESVGMVRVTVPSADCIWIVGPVIKPTDAREGHVGLMLCRNISAVVVPVSPTRILAESNN